MKIINWTAASTSDMYSYLTHRITVQQKEPISQFSQRTDVNTSPIEQVSHIVWQLKNDISGRGGKRFTPTLLHTTNLCKLSMATREITVES